MFNEDTTASQNEPGFTRVAPDEIQTQTDNTAIMGNTPDAGTSINEPMDGETPVENHDISNIPGIAAVLWKTSPSFYWTRNEFTQEPELAVHSNVARFLAEASLYDVNELKEFCLVADKDGVLDQDASKAAYGSTRDLIKQLRKNDEERISLWSLLEGSDYEANGCKRNTERAACLASMEIVYWKEEQFRQREKLEASGREYIKDSWYNTLGGYIANAVRKYAAYSSMAFGNSADGTLSYLPKTDAKGEYVGGPTQTMIDIAQQFLKGRARSETKRLVAEMRNLQNTQKHSNAAERTLDPSEQKRQELRAKYHIAA